MKRLAVGLTILALVAAGALAGASWLTPEQNATSQGGLTDRPAAKADAASSTESANPVEADTSDRAVILENPAERILQPSQLHPMAIESLRAGNYPGGVLAVTENLSHGSNYRRQVVAYESEGLTIYGLLTVPLGEPPAGGWPAVLFLHGYIPPKQYSTVSSYPTYQARLARAGFVTFKPDLRGHGSSEGEAVGAHFSEKYVVDTLNALAYLKAHPEVDPSRIGYWGHSNGGEIGLRVLVTAPETVKAASLWAGVVGSYRDMLETHIAEIDFLQRAPETELVQTHGLPSENPEFWNQLDPYSYLGDITAAVQLQHATGDESVPVVLSQRLVAEMERAGKSVEYIEYRGDDHNIAGNAATAWARTIRFFEDSL